MMLASKQAFELEINDEDKRVDRNHFQSLQDPKLQDLETDFHPSGVVLQAERKKNRSTSTDLKSIGCRSIFFLATTTECSQSDVMGLQGRRNQ